jgi:chorismate mutase
MKSNPENQLHLGGPPGFMDNKVPATEALDQIRRDIDEIDDALLRLLERRFQAVAEVRAIKEKTGGGNSSPLRPAREAEILRRLMECDTPGVPPELRYRVWRAILAASSLSQAPLHIHVSAGLLNSASLRLAVREHFGAIPEMSHNGEDSVLGSLAANPGDVAVVAVESPWLGAYMVGRAGKAHVIGCLPWKATGNPPIAFIFGFAAAEPTGADETLLITDGQLPRDFTPAPLWQMRLEGKRLTCLPGFLSEHNMPLVGLKRSNAPLALNLLGRYPSPLEVR